MDAEASPLFFANLVRRAEVPAVVSYASDLNP